MNRPEGPRSIGHIIHLIEWNASVGDEVGESLISEDLRRIAAELRGVAVAHFGYRLEDLVAGDYAIHA
jgi:hypothetical protein